MIDLHSHILPGLDDGARDIEISIEMARLAVADGVTVMACTPHVTPGLYDNTVDSISSKLSLLTRSLLDRRIALTLCMGADVHVAPDLPEKLLDGSVPTLNGTRYFLFEPPHHVLPPNLEKLAGRLINAGFIPILTHPERLTWISSRYDVVENLNDLGCLIQLTADSIIGAFGKNARYYSDKLLDEGRVDIVASDCHGVRARRPGLSKARAALEQRLGSAEAERMVLSRPAAILCNDMLRPVGLASRPTGKSDEKFGFLGRLLKGAVQ